MKEYIYYNIEIGRFFIGNISPYRYKNFGICFETQLIYIGVL